MENQIEQNSIPDPSPVPPQKKSSILVPVLIILVILLTGLCAYFAYRLYSQNFPSFSGGKACTMEAKICPDGTTVGRTGPDCEFEACPSAASDPTAGWETYNGTVPLFFKYPSGYTLKEQLDSIEIQKNPARALIHISILDNPNKLPASQWFESLSPDVREPIVSTHTRSLANIGGQTAVKFVKQDKSKDFLIILTHETKGYFVYFGPSEDEMIITDQILSTFQFTD